MQVATAQSAGGGRRAGRLTDDANGRADSVRGDHGRWLQGGAVRA
jgi:hypothetical protein